MTKKSVVISKSEARQIAVTAQGLHRVNPFGIGLRGTEKALQHLGYVQIDTISVVERAHHHILWSRVADYHSEFLDRLIEQKKAFEYWSHAASYLPMCDYRFSLPRKQHWKTRESQWFPASRENRQLKVRILDRIAAEGPLAARDFAGPRPQKSTGWWDHKPAKRALEQLFMEGELMAVRRQGFQKIYDLTERVLPKGVDCTLPTPQEEAQHLIRSSLRAHGLMRPAEISYLRSRLRQQVQTECRRLLADGELEQISVSGIEADFLALKTQWPRLLSQPCDQALRVLSPFDSFVIQRQRLRELFEYDYTIECYVPEAKRKFGYFSLPLLKNLKFVGRMDAKSERKHKTLAIRRLHAEGTPQKSSKQVASVLKEIRKGTRQEIDAFAKFNRCTSYAVQHL